MDERSRRGTPEGGPHPAHATGRDFGRLLRRYRALARLTQEELAQRSGYSTDYISKLEREQRRPPMVVVDRLAGVLGLGESERQALLAARERSGTKQAGEHMHWAPLPMPPTPLVGRLAEQAAVDKALGCSRLVTLTGVGGTGKTRLALAVAQAATTNGAFADGVVFVECAPLGDPGLLAPTVARTLGLVDQPGLTAEAHLAQMLHARHLLLVVDNLEHLLPEAALLGRLLAAAPRLHVLATSRAPLCLYGEYEIRVPPLSLPATASATEPSEHDLASSEAVDLFVARAKAAAPRFVATGRTLAAVAAICVALDGLPLAIELAAARVRLWPPEALLPRLGERLAVLVGGPQDRPERHQTLRATLDWSYALLARTERTLFARLGVFPGSFDAAAAAAICAASGPHEADMDGASHRPLRDATLEHMLLPLESLTVQSLLEVSPGATPRFRMLETVRAYALLQLSDSGAAEDVRKRHLHYYVELAEALSANLQGPQQGACLEHLAAELDNFRTALGWARASGAFEVGLRLAVALGRFWRPQGLLREGLDWLETLLAIADGASPAMRARALSSAGTLAWRLGDYERAASFLTESLVLSRALGDRVGVARALDALGNVAYRRGDSEQAESAYAEALALRRQEGDLHGVSIALGNLGRLALQQEDTGRALALLEETLALKRHLGDTRGIAGTLTSLGRLAARHGDAARATALFEESLALKRTIGDRYGRVTTLVHLASAARAHGESTRAAAHLREAVQIGQEIGASDRVAEALEGMAAVAAADGRFEAAARVGAAAETLRGVLGLPLSSDQRAGHEQMVRLASAALGNETFAAVWAMAAAQPVEQAITAVLQQTCWAASD